MKYSGNISILNDQGNAVFERELTPDEIIEVLLGRSAGGGLKEEPEAKPQASTSGRRSAKIAKPASKGCEECGSPSRHKKECSRAGSSGKRSRPQKTNGVIHDCCGSKGPRHRQDCPSSKNLTSKGNHKVNGGRKTFSEPLFDVVKDALDHGTTVDGIVAEQGIDFLEVRRVNLSDSYDDYLEIA